MATPSEGRYVYLRGGLTLPIEPVRLVLDLEARGFSLTRDAEDVVTVRPASRLTAEDREALTRWREHVRALVRYSAAPPEVM
jgi:hypothetical protein